MPDSYDKHLPPNIVRKSPRGSHARKSAGKSKMTKAEHRALIDDAFNAVMANPKWRTPKILEGFAEEYAKLG